MGYLVLSRRLNEKILIGPDIEILIADIRENSRGEPVVDIALKAPKNIKILKQETYLGDLKNGFNTRNKSR